MLRNFRNWMIPLVSVLVSMTTISLVNDLSGLLTECGRSFLSGDSYINYLDTWLDFSTPYTWVTRS